MRTLLIALVLLPAFLHAQSPVDRLANTLDSLATVSFDAWMMSPDLKTARLEGANPAAPGFDDSRWERLELGARAYPDSCWLRKQIVLPERIMGNPVQGRIRILLTLDDYGSLWVNGEPRGKFLWDGSFVVTEEARPGDMFTLAIRAVNTGGPLRLLRAELEMESTRDIARTMKDFALSLRVGQRLLSFDTYQVNAYSGQKEDP
ncbi:MAG TPA: hypothetical protein VLT13_14320, partial [Bacteroidota bacterium]|nr:hypothetical protein [Bacteroidota bacterium]